MDLGLDGDDSAEVFRDLVGFSRIPYNLSFGYLPVTALPETRVFS